MSIYTQMSYLPIIFQVGSGKIKEISSILSSKNLSFNNILLLSGGTYSYDFATQISMENLNEHEVVQGNTFSEVNRISDIVYNKRFDLILAVGGGKVLDVAKRISQLQRINHISIPTIISNDGLISPISVLKDEKGVTQSISGNMPTGVIIDIDLVDKAPRRYLQAAAGDILSNMSATNDWLVAAAQKKERINDIGFQLSLMAGHALLNFKDIDLTSKHFLKTVIQGQVNSGLAMSLSGSSRPCSGSEHLISHAIDRLEISESTLHGFQVGILSLFCLFLQNKLNKVHLDYSKEIGLDANINEVFKLDEKDWEKVFKVSRRMRPGRLTVLESYTNKELVEKLKIFLEVVSE